MTVKKINKEDGVVNMTYELNGIIFEDKQQYETVKLLINNFETTQKTNLIIKLAELVNTLKVFGITDKDQILNTLKENKKELWNIF